MKKAYKIWGTLYLRISATFLFLLIIIGLVYIFIIFHSVKDYYQEANQKLNVTIAAHIAAEIKPFVDGKVNNAELEHIFHNTMVLNPAIEIYLLDKEGKILSYFAPGKEIKLSKIDLLPIKEFLQTNGQEFVCGDDPRKPTTHKVFSAAEVKENGNLRGYLYVVLAGEDYDSIIELLRGSFFVRVGTLTIMLTLIAALLIGIFIIWILTRNLRVIVGTFKRFAKGDLQARIQIKSTSELSILANTFNEMADTIVDNIDKLKALEKLKSELITNISHDLRTPLALIHGYVETLTIREDRISPDEKKRYMQTVLKNTEKLEKLVTDLFEISKLDSLQIKPNKEPFFITELISDILNKYQLLAESKNIKIINNIAPNIKRIYADLSMIDRVLQNLIDNAIKFTKGGEITIIVKNKDQATVEIKIYDTGSGISKQDLPLIFNRFYTSGRNEDSNGSGLGLSIVKKIIDIHNTNIVVESEIGKGTVFTFWLDVYETPKHQAPQNVKESILQNTNLYPKNQLA